MNRIYRFVSTFALVITALLCVQWPLRDLVQRFSREANDLGQIFFGIYVAIAMAAATRAGVHLAGKTSTAASPRPARGRAWFEFFAWHHGPFFCCGRPGRPSAHRSPRLSVFQRAETTVTF